MNSNETKSTVEQKREAAIQYLRSRNIYRADVNCAHRYENRLFTPPPPRIDVYRYGIQQSNEE